MQKIILIIFMLMLVGCASAQLGSRSVEMQDVIRNAELGNFESALSTLMKIPADEKGYVFYEIRSSNHKEGKVTTWFPKKVLVGYISQLKAWSQQQNDFCSKVKVSTDESETFNLKSCYSGFADDPNNQRLKFKDDYDENLQFNWASYERDFDSSSCKDSPHMAYCSPFGQPASELFAKVASLQVKKLSKDLEALEESKRQMEDKQAKQQMEKRAKPDFKKCSGLQQKIESEGMINLWKRNIESSRSRAKEIGQMTQKISDEIDNSLSMIEGFKYRLKQANKVLSELSDVQVSPSHCKELIEGFGKSTADQYLKGN